MYTALSCFILRFKEAIVATIYIFQVYSIHNLHILKVGGGISIWQKT